MTHQITLDEAVVRLDAINAVVWDEALPYMFDPEHLISCHADTLPEAYRKLVAAINKILEQSNFRPDPG